MKAYATEEKVWNDKGKLSFDSNQNPGTKFLNVPFTAKTCYPPEFALPLSIRTSQSDQPKRIVIGVKSCSGYGFDGGFLAHRFG